MFEPFLRYLPRYLDRDPSLRPALRLIAPAPATWRVREDRLVLAWGDQARDFDLTEHTLASLVDALQLDGFELAWFDQDLLALGAVILWDGSGTIADRDGTELQARTSILHALTGALEHEWVTLRDAIPDAAAQVSMATAAQAWLDRHGRLYGIPRPAGLDDPDYRDHLMAEIARPRGNARGIEFTLRRRLGEDIRVIEPWQWLARWSLSPLSAAHRLQDGVRWGRNLLHLAFQDPGDWRAAQAITQADRDAGNLLIDPAWWPLARRVDVGLHDLSVALMRTDVRPMFARVWYHPRWNLSAASDYSLVRNPRFMITLWRAAYMEALARPVSYGASWTGRWDFREWRTGGVWHGEPPPVTTLNRARHFCRGDAVWSEDTPLGDLNTRFRGGWVLDVEGAARGASVDLALSDYIVKRQERPICQWGEQALAPCARSSAGELAAVTLNQGVTVSAPRLLDADGRPLLDADGRALFALVDDMS